MAVTGHTFSQLMQTIRHGLSTAMVSKGEMKPAACGQTATQAPHRMQAFQSIMKTTGLGPGMAFSLNLAKLGTWVEITG